MGQSHKTASTDHKATEEKGEPKRIRTEVPLLTARPNRLSLFTTYAGLVTTTPIPTAEHKMAALMVVFSRLPYYVRINLVKVGQTETVRETDTKRRRQKGEEVCVCV